MTRGVYFHKQFKSHIGSYLTMYFGFSYHFQVITEEATTRLFNSVLKMVQKTEMCRQVRTALCQEICNGTPLTIIIRNMKAIASAT